jgi:hypothetical protein
LVRKLLWERVPAEQIAVVVAGRGMEETKWMFLGGVEMVARHGVGEVASCRGAEAAPEVWMRVPVAPGVELHLRDGFRKLKPAELRMLMERVEAALRRNH